jgi:membrane protease YdiL (CAAX protease family)
MSRAVSSAADSARAVPVTTGYLFESSRPLTSLVFLLPFVLLYEVGVRLLLTDPVQGTQHIVAFTLLQKMFAAVGAGLLLWRFFPLSAPSPRGAIPEMLVLCLGAGVYEELVFRLILCTGLAIGLRNVLRMSERSTMLLVVVCSATLFSAYHYLGNESFNWRIFVFRLVAGVYFSLLFLLRGFGITAGSHMAYDIIAVLR